MDSLGFINLWKISFERQPEYKAYQKIRKISGEVLDKFVDFIDPDFDDYSDVIRIELFDLMEKYKIHFDVELKEIDSHHTLKAMLYCYDNGGKISQKYLDNTRIRKPEKLNMIKSIIDSKSSFFEVIREGSKPYKIIIRDVMTNEEYEIIDTGVAFAHRFMNEIIRSKYLLTTLMNYDGINFVDNSLLLDKNDDDVKFLLTLCKKHNFKPLHTWFLASTLTNIPEEI